MTESYESLLDAAYEQIPEEVTEKERLELPKVRGHLQGNKTIVTNFHQIASLLHRKPEMMLKYLSKELATPIDLKKNCIMIGAKVPASRINEKVEKFFETFVVCKECAKPDTKLIKEGSFLFKKCMACGAKEYVKA